VKVWAVQDAKPHMTKKQIHSQMFPWYFPTLTSEEMKGKKVIYLLLLFPAKEVIVKKLRKNDYDIGHFIPIVDVRKFLRGSRSDSDEIICDCCGSLIRTEKARYEHINKGCYSTETQQLKLSEENEFFKTPQYCAKNTFVFVGDTETEMKNIIEQLEPESDWDEEHLPQECEIHALTEHKEIFEKFHIPLHYKIQGSDCIKKCVEEYLLLFDKEDKNRMSFNKFVKEQNYPIQMSDKQLNQSKLATKCCLCGKPFDDAYFHNANDRNEFVEINENHLTPMSFSNIKKKYFKKLGLRYKEFKDHTLSVGLSSFMLPTLLL
jgi:hypothetical protein